MPFDTNSEAGIVATLLFKPNFIVYSEHIKPNFFYLKEYAILYWAIQELYKKGVDKIDEFNIITQISSNKKTAELIKDKKDNYLPDLIEKLAYVKRESKEEYLHLCDIVISMSFKREVYKKIKEFETRALDSKDLDLNKLNRDLVTGIDNLAINYLKKDDVILFHDRIDELYQSVINKRVGDCYGIPSKFSNLDEYFSYQKSELYLFTAQTNKGKSVLALNECLHKIENGIPVVYLDSEMADEQFFTRMVSLKSAVEEWKIKTGKMSELEELAVLDAIKFMKNTKLLYREYNPSWTHDKIYTTLKILKHKMNFQFLIFDYLKSMDNATSSSEIYNSMGNTTNFLKNDIAGGFDIPVLSMAQLNRNEDIADSYKIQQFTSVMTKWSPKEPDEILTDGAEYGNYKMEIIKNRIGKTTNDDEYLNFYFNKPILTISAVKEKLKNTPEFMKG